MKALATILFSCLIGTCGTPATPDGKAAVLAGMEAASGPLLERKLTDPFDGSSASGNYLASQFAQRQHDWNTAGSFLDSVIRMSPDDTLLLSKAMVLAMGAGQPEKAVAMAKKVLAQEDKNVLALLFIATEYLRDKKYDEAAASIKGMPAGSLSEFILPLLESWSQAGIGTYNVDALGTNTIHLYHATLIANYMNKQDQIEPLLQMALSAQGLTLEDLDRIGDVYAHIGKIDTAMEIYSKTLEEWPDNPAVLKKINLLKAGKSDYIFKPVASPAEGIAQAMYDMARLLFQEYSDESARVFANMALFIDPNMTAAELLMAHITARNERVDDAIAYYQKVAPGNESFLEARRLAAGLLEETKQTDRALAELESLFRDYNDLESLIEIGDIYREHEDFEKAVGTYNRVQESLGNAVPKEYWHLLYVRGMSYEQMGQWEKAEADLKAALEFQPDHPFVLNYLGYAWADQGVNLKESLELIRKAAALRPEDGYIADSLGWVLYRMGQNKEAVPHLERAVELMPYDAVINDHLGDAYWRVGRKLEARFQWLRAKNHSQDQKILTQIDQKLDHGLQSVDIVKEARTQTGENPDILKP